MTTGLQSLFADTLAAADTKPCMWQLCHLSLMYVTHSKIEEKYCPLGTPMEASTSEPVTEGVQKLLQSAQHLELVSLEWDELRKKIYI